MITYKRIDEVEEDLLSIDDPIKTEYLRVDFDFEDNYIKSLLQSTVLWLEKELRMPLFKANYNAVINLTEKDEYDYPKIDPYLEFRHIKVNEITSIKGVDIYGRETALAVDTDYLYNEATNRLFFPSRKNIASYAIEHLIIECNLGFTKNNLPEDIKQALYGLVAYFYENRGTNLPMPLEIINGVSHYKRWY